MLVWKTLQISWEMKKTRKGFYLAFPPVECLAKANPAAAVCQTHHTEHQPCLAAFKSPNHIIVELSFFLRPVAQLCFDGDILDAAVVCKGANNAKVDIN